MTSRRKTDTDRPSADHPRRGVALVAAFSLLLMAVLAPFANLGVLHSLIVPADASATTAGIVASAGLFRTAIVALLIVAILDVVVAWAFYVLLRPVNERLALLVGWARVVYAAVFAYALASLVDVARLLDGAVATAGQSTRLQAQVASSIASFNTGWDVALAIFGLHLVGLGALLVRSGIVPRFLGLLVVVAGAGYVADSLGKILVPGYALTISSLTFAGEALLIVWLFGIAATGSRSSESSSPVMAWPARPSEAVAS